MSELKAIGRHAGTVLIGQLAVMAFGIADTVIAGRYSDQALALAALSAGFQRFACHLLQHMST